MRVTFKHLRSLILALCLIPAAAEAQSQPTAFSYQGRLTDGGVAANGTYDFQFGLYDDEGNLLILLVPITNVSVINGIFTVNPNFGTTWFDGGGERFVEVRVKEPADPDFTILSPRQRIVSTPYALRSLKAEGADDSRKLGGIDWEEYVLDFDTRLSDSRDPNPGSPNYIQNTIAHGGQQPGSSFNVSGSGTVGGVLTLSSGTASAPSFTFTGDTDTGIWRSGANALNFSTGGTQRMSIASNGVSLTNGTAAAPSFSFIGDTDTGIWRSGTNTLNFSTAGVERMRITSTGSVGIGTESPTSSLSFAGGGLRRVGIERPSTPETTGSTLQLVAGGSTEGGENLNGGNIEIVSGFATGSGSSSIRFFTTPPGTPGTGITGPLFRMTITGTGNVGIGTQTPTDPLHVNGTIRVAALGSAGSTGLCRNGSNQIATCSSSLRYKSNVNDFRSGLDIVNRLRPVSFSWKDGGMRDLGLGAEEVAEIEPLLVTYNDNGKVEGVKYDRIGVVLLNAVKEQQEQIERQQKQIEEQKAMIEGLLQLVCSGDQKAAVCLSKEAKKDED